MDVIDRSALCMCRQGLGMELFFFKGGWGGGGGWRGGEAMERPLFENGIYVTLNVDNRGL